LSVLKKNITTTLIVLIILVMLFFASLFLIEPVFFWVIHLDPVTYEGLAEFYTKKNEFKTAEKFFKKLEEGDFVPHRIYFKAADMYEKWGKKELFYDQLIKGTLRMYLTNSPLTAPAPVYIDTIKYEIENFYLDQATETMCIFADVYPSKKQEIETFSIRLMREGLQQAAMPFIHYLIRQGYYRDAGTILEKKPQKNPEDLYLISVCMQAMGEQWTARPLIRQSIMSENPPLMGLVTIDSLTTDPFVLKHAKETLNNSYEVLAKRTPEAGAGYLPLNSYSRKYTVDFVIHQDSRIIPLFQLRSTSVLDIYGILLLTFEHTGTGEQETRQVYVDADDYEWFSMPVVLEPGRYSLTFRLANNFYLEGRFDRSIFMKEFRLLRPTK